MRWKIATSAAAAIRRHAWTAHPEEACGLLLGQADWIAEAAATENVAADPRDSFEIDPATLFTAQRAERQGGPALLGYYHSHPNGLATPSSRDLARAAPDGKVWIIAAGGQLNAFVAVETGQRVRFRPINLMVS